MAQDSKTWFIEIRGIKFTEEDFDNLQPIIEIPPVVDEFQHKQSEDVKFDIGGCEESTITEEFCEQLTPNSAMTLTQQCLVYLHREYL